MAETQTQFDYAALPRTEQPELGKDATIAQRFEAFHRLNPQVYMALTAMAREKKRNGRTRMGMKLLFELLRDRYEVLTEGEKYKLNNNYTAHYARMIMEDETDLTGFFSTRERKGRLPR